MSTRARRRARTRRVPTGCSIFPESSSAVTALGGAALPRHPLLERADRGGHFAAFEQPELFVDEIRAAFARSRRA